MKKQIRDYLYNVVWAEEAGEKDLPEFDAVMTTAAIEDPDTRADKIVDAAASLQRVAWAAGFDYALKFMVELLADK